MNFSFFETLKRTSFSRLLYKAHLFVGVFVSVHCLVLFATGAVLLFRDEIESLGKDGGATIAAESCCVDPALFGAVLSNATALYPSDRPLSIALDEHDPTAIQVRMGIDGSTEFRGARRLVYDSQTGKQRVAGKTKQESFFDRLLELHRDFLLGSTGKLYVGFIGLLYVFTLVSGSVIYGNFMKRSRFSEIRTQTKRARLADLHKMIGASVFAWSLMIGFTGTLLAFNSTLLKIFQYTELRSLTESYGKQATQEVPRAPLPDIIESAQQAAGDARVSFIAFPGTQFSTPNHFLILANGVGRFQEKLSELVVVDAQSAKTLEVRELPLYLKALMLSEPLHFGDYGGPLLKVAWLVLTPLTAVLPVSGLVILYHRKRRKSDTPGRRPAIQWIPRSSPLARPYVIPATLVATSVVAVAGALFVEGIGDHLAALIAGGPAAGLLAVSWIMNKRARAS